MIRRTFTVFEGVGPERERDIKAAGIGDWDEFLAARAVPGMPASVRGALRRKVRRWNSALAAGDAGFFVHALPRPKHWMLFDAFADGVRYLDIETTGLSAHRHDVTVVGIHDGRRCRPLVRGKGLTAAALERALGGCKLLVTYYGTQFDVPFLQAKFPAITWDMPHFDLCFGGRRVGLTGGMKGVERTLGIGRSLDLLEVDGREAVRLWRAHERGDAKALDRLLAYNEADTRNLEQMAREVYRRLCEKAGAPPGTGMRDRA